MRTTFVLVLSLLLFATLACSPPSALTPSPESTLSAVSASATPAPLASATPSVSATAAPTAQPTIAASATTAPSTPTPTSTRAASPTATRTLLPSVTATNSATPTATPTPTTTPTPSLSLNGPQQLALFAKTGNLWVTNRLGNSLAEVDARNPSRVLKIIPNIPSPNGIAIWQAGGLAYVSNRDQGTLSEVDLVSARVLRTFRVGTLPWGVAVDQSSGDVWVANFGSNSVTCIERRTSQLFESASLGQPTFLASSSAPNARPFVVGRSGTVLSLYCRDHTGVAQVADNSLFGIVVRGDSSGGWVTALDSKRVLGWGRQSGAITLPNAPYAIADFGRCLGALVPAEDALYTLDYDLKRVLKVHAVGKQSVGEGGHGLVYSASSDTAYITNYAAHSITSISKPCP